MRICLVYDCLFPHTVGGAERWYRNLAERLAADGHEVTYLTLRQWERGESADVEGVDVRSAGPRMGLYTETGRRRILPPLVFGAGVLLHLLLHGGRYDAVHTASFPYFSVLAAALARPLRRFRLVVDWHEVWSRDYWREYLGAAGAAGWWVQALCARVRQRAFCFSRLHGARLREVGGPEATVLEGEYVGSLERPDPAPAERVVVFAGRHIPEKRVPALVPAVVEARKRLPDLRCEIFGDGPDGDEVARRVEAGGLGDVIALRGFAPIEEVGDALQRALCMVLPSRREGYGLIVVEASAAGTPSVVVEDPDNAATELVEEGVNGFVARSASAADLADAIVRVDEAGPAMRDATAAWFERNARRLSLESSLETVVDSYRSA
jgi:glycosyltransferase involved in cell wall biosynthesis